MSPTHSIWLWSRRSGVRVPSLTLSERPRLAGPFCWSETPVGWSGGAVVPLRCTTWLLLAAWTTFLPSLPRRGQDGGACRRAVKVGPSACAARTVTRLLDRAPVTRGALPRCGRERGRQAVFAVAISPQEQSRVALPVLRRRGSGADRPGTNRRGHVWDGRDHGMPGRPVSLHPALPAPSHGGVCRSAIGPKMRCSGRRATDFASFD